MVSAMLKPDKQMEFMIFSPERLLGSEFQFNIVPVYHIPSQLDTNVLQPANKKYGSSNLRTYPSTANFFDGLPSMTKIAPSEDAVNIRSPFRENLSTVHTSADLW